jgi:hypothetical protein
VAQNPKNATIGAQGDLKSVAQTDNREKLLTTVDVLASLAFESLIRQATGVAEVLDVPMTDALLAEIRARTFRAFDIEAHKLGVNDDPKTLDEVSEASAGISPEDMPTFRAAVQRGYDETRAQIARDAAVRQAAAADDEPQPDPASFVSRASHASS